MGKVYNTVDKQFFRVENSEMGKILVSDDNKRVYLGSALSSNPKDWEYKGVKVEAWQRCVKCPFKTETEKGHPFCGKYWKPCLKVLKQEDCKL